LVRYSRRSAYQIQDFLSLSTCNDLGINLQQRLNKLVRQIRHVMAPRKKTVVGSKTSKLTRSTKAAYHTIPTPGSRLTTILPPLRAHHVSYHYPLLLSDQLGCDSLLNWFNGVETTRKMPWRKPWIDPKDFEGQEEELGKVLGKRAYEVWVSEVSKST
jgi:A/G-specific adenine glycosylase